MTDTATYNAQARADQRLASISQALRERPHTAHEVADLIGIAHSLARHYMDILMGREDGLKRIFIAEWAVVGWNHRVPAYSWRTQTEGDAPRPSSADGLRRVPGHARPAPPGYTSDPLLAALYQRQ